MIQIEEVLSLNLSRLFWYLLSHPTKSRESSFQLSVSSVIPYSSVFWLKTLIKVAFQPSASQKFAKINK